MGRFPKTRISACVFPSLHAQLAGEARVAQLELGHWSGGFQRRQRRDPTQGGEWTCLNLQGAVGRCPGLLELLEEGVTTKFACNTGCPPMLLQTRRQATPFPTVRVFGVVSSARARQLRVARARTTMEMMLARHRGKWDNHFPKSKQGVSLSS